jgi:membrane protease YdiL (CAAX protease family)
MNLSPKKTYSILDTRKQTMWNRLPVFLRALLTGLAVTAVPTLVWGALVTANFASRTRWPWAAAAMACFLVLYWKYLQGWGWPQRTAAPRRQGLRSFSLSAGTWRWALLAGGSGQGSSIALLIVVHRLVRWPHSVGPDLGQFSASTILATLVMSAIVAGISEEAGFRGYMQGSLERHYGPAFAIAMASVVFGLVHLSHGAFLPAILFDAGWGALYGLLTYRTGSILPAVILHSMADALEFILAWKFPPSTPRPLVWESGPDAIFWIDCGLIAFMGAASVWAFGRLARAMVTEQSASFASAE